MQFIISDFLLKDALVVRRTLLNKNGCFSLKGREESLPWRRCYVDSFYFSLSDVREPYRPPSYILFFRRSLRNDRTRIYTHRESGDVCAPQQIAAVSLYTQSQ